MSFWITDTPMKAESMVTPTSKCRGKLLEDPRPPDMRSQPGYSDFVRNTIINYVAATQDDVAIRYLYEKADMQAASQDHDYCEIPYTEYMVDKSKCRYCRRSCSTGKSNPWTD